MSDNTCSRDETFDVLKGIAIILVIVGHCNLSIYLDSVIDSFHMPLFFFVAGYFLKERPLKEEFSLCIKRLILPYVFVAFCATFIAMCIDLAHYTWADGSYTQGKIISYLLGYNGQINPSWFPGGGMECYGFYWLCSGLE